MRGSITKKGSTWSIIVDIGKVNGKRKQKWYNGFKTKKEAEKELTKILYQLENNTFVNPNKITLEDYLQHWISDYAMVNLAPSTIRGYRTNI